jgi:hypothetical protein
VFRLPWRATRSVSSRLTFLNFSWRTFRGSKGLGRLLALSTLVVVPSRRPSSTPQRGPPAWVHVHGFRVSSGDAASFELKFRSMNARRDCGAHEFDGDLSREGKDVGAGDDAGARVLERGLDVVDHGKAAGRIVVGDHVLLGLDRRQVVVQQKRAVATLKHLAFVACQINDAMLDLGSIND